VAPPVFKTGLAGNTLAGRFDSFPSPPFLSLEQNIRDECPWPRPANFAPARTA
jgi:hypothetical protein